jgi:hypothetical protein
MPNSLELLIVGKQRELTFDEISALGSAVMNYLKKINFPFTGVVLSEIKYEDDGDDNNEIDVEKK